MITPYSICHDFLLQLKISDSNASSYESYECISLPVRDRRQVAIQQVDFRDHLEIDFLVSGFVLLT